jgi:hypothetical protein
VQRALTFHPELWERVRRHALLNNRTNVSVVEQALAEHLAIPLADPDLPEQPVELCPRCEKGVLWQGKCPVCSWRRVERPHWRKNHPPTLPTRAPEN